MIYAAVLAGGTGTRMGNTDKPKQFLEFGGRPVIVHTVGRFLACSDIDRVIVMTPTEWCGYTVEIIANYFEEKKRAYITRKDEQIELIIRKMD